MSADYKASEEVTVEDEVMDEKDMPLSPKVRPTGSILWRTSYLVDRIYDYDYRDVHDDLEKGIKAGAYGWDNACYLAIAERRANVDLNDFHSRRTKDEFYIPEMKELLDNPETQKYWKRIVTFDPLGMTATNPSIASTTACLNIPELPDLDRDGTIVNDDGSINTIKAAVYYAWNLPALAERLDIPLKQLRQALYKYTNNPDVLDARNNTFLPQVGGFTCYIFGDPRKIREKRTKIAVRVHDECNGSDVFGTTICTCRPYLVFALRATVECAQRGGVGVVVYFRKEGRSLGEVVKYRVYNARKNQIGGDTAEKYFFQTENIAGIRDARFQTMMPDVLNWLGITRIDYLMSMSNEKYDAIVDAGITVQERVPLPDMYVPKHAFVEITAKIMSGYHTEKVEGGMNEVQRKLNDLRTIRSQCGRVFELAKKNKLQYLGLHLDKLDVAVDAVMDCIEQFYPEHNIPMHSRFRHFDEKEMAELRDKWLQVGVDKREVSRRMIDLVFISVLLDAGAGANWKYIDAKGVEMRRSEGLARASFQMFLDGLFSSDVAIRTRVNSYGLEALTTHKLAVGFQVTQGNEMVGLDGRCKLLNRLGESMRANPQIFGYEVFRPGHLLDYALSNCDDTGKVSLRVIWKALTAGLSTIWPEQRNHLSSGDVFVHSALKKIGEPGSDCVPFHKLQQWLCYSLIEEFQNYGIKFEHLEEMTALAEYRNGGLLLDTGVLSLKAEADPELVYDTGSEVVVEWRALTVCCVDLIADRVRERLKKTKEEMPLANILEAGTWRAGRIIAAKKRANAVPPLKIRSDGTVF